MADDDILQHGQSIIGDILANHGHAKSNDDELLHYASKYYDPVKAKEYYERTKQLKGRGTSGMSSTQREVANVSRSNIREQRTKELTSARDTQKANLEKLRATAETRRKGIADKLQKLAKDLKAKQEKLANEVIFAKPINKIPANATPAQRAYLTKMNDRIRAGNRKNAEKAIKQKGRESQVARERASSEMAKVGKELSTALKTARDGYRTQTEAIKKKYKSAETTELNNIRKQVR